jgi:GST-like protein
VDKPITIYGAIGSGSVPIEAALTLVGLPYDVIETRLDTIAADRGFARVNPMRQVPGMVLPGGELVTESAAILIWLADRYPDAGLAPTALHRKRPAFLRWMSFVSSAIYALYWIRDDPSRLSDDAAEQARIRERTAARMSACWAMMEAQIEPGLYLQGDTLGVLDLYVTVISRWGPRRKRFYEVAPRMGEVVRRVDGEPMLEAFWAERFPFEDGWEG